MLVQVLIKSTKLKFIHVGFKGTNSILLRPFSKRSQCPNGLKHQVLPSTSLSQTSITNLKDVSQFNLDFGTYSHSFKQSVSGLLSLKVSLHHWHFYMKTSNRWSKLPMSEQCWKLQLDGVLSIIVRRNIINHSKKSK